MPLKNIVDNVKVFPLKNTINGFLFSAIKYFPSKSSLIDLEKTQKIIADDINVGGYDVVLCEQDRYTMAPFFLNYVKKPHVYYCQQPNIFRYDVAHSIYKKAGLEYKNLLEGIYLKFYGSKLINHDRKYARYAKYMVVNSNFSRGIISGNYGINSFVSYLGVDNELFRPMNVQKENFVLSVGQCIPEKGYEFIINALAKIDVDIRPEFVIVSDQGNVHWRNYLEKLATKMNVKLKILSMISDEELILLYNQAILMVYAPYLEPFGLVPLEAMSCGTPVVAVNDGGVRESVIHDKTGILTERNETVFAGAVAELILNNEKSEKMGEESINVVKKFWTLKNSGKRLFNHLNSALDFYD
ncbi:MAG: glycosyltransferase [Methanobacterium paludis]|nr:glycosyltransferase [Methanobacterium paludis]